MGLLRLAEQFQKENSEGSRPSARELLENFNHPPEKIDFPYAVFNLYKSLIGFKWGMILLPNEAERRYFVWASTEHSSAKVQGFTLSFDQPEIVAPTEMLIPFVPGHSNELPHEVIHGGNLLILGDIETPTACIYCESPIEPVEERELKTLNHHLGRKIRQSRKIIDYEIESLAPANWLNRIKHEKAIILIINIEKAAALLLEAVPGMIQEVAWREVAGIIRHFKGRIGYLYDLRDGRLLLLAPLKRMPDHELYLHQLSTSYTSTLQLPRDSSCFQAHAVEWPEEKHKIVEEFPGLFS